MGYFISVCIDFKIRVQCTACHFTQMFLENNITKENKCLVIQIIEIIVTSLHLVGKQTHIVV